MKVVFFGTPAFSCPFLQALIKDENIDVVSVFSQPDKAAGRGGNVQPCAVKLLAQDHLIPVHTPKSLKTDANISEILNNHEADLFVVVAYGKILPAAILDIPKLGAINVHPSLLPRHRGPSPMQGAIELGDTQTGVAIMLLDEGMDTGPILATETIDIDESETYSSLEQKVHLHGPQLLVETLHRYAVGQIQPVEQDDSKATLTQLLHREDGHVVWSQTMGEIERKSRAWEKWPGLWSMWDRSRGVCLRLKFLEMKPVDFVADVPPGTATTHEGKLFVDCSNGTLEILQIQLEGKPKMNAGAFIQGYPDINGALLT
jgi:methionyl-tRNA formyltransferase